MSKSKSTTRKAPKVVIAPKGCANYLTPGKEYNVISDDREDHPRFGFGFDIADDEGDNIFCTERECAHLNGQNWIIKE